MFERSSISDILILKSELQPEFGTVPDRPFEQTRVENISKTYSAIGWKPKTTLDQGLRQTAEWYKQNHVF